MLKCSPIDTPLSNQSNSSRIWRTIFAACSICSALTMTEALLMHPCLISLAIPRSMLSLQPKSSALMIITLLCIPLPPSPPLQDYNIFVMNRQSVAKRAQLKQGEIFNHICTYFALLEQQENVLQAYREAITTRSDFHPLALFNYISRGEGLITRRHVLQMLEENRIAKSDDEVKILFGLYGYKERVDFVGFLNFIYPSTIEPLKYISTVGLKRYSGIPIEQGVNEEIVCLVVLLLSKEIEFIQSLQLKKQEAFPRLSKHQIKKIMRMIKKKGESKSVYEIQSQNVITFAEMRLCLRKARNMQENKINAICRRLSMGKDNFINLEQMEFWLKSWNRIKNQDIFEKDPPKTLMDDFETSIFR